LAGSDCSWRYWLLPFLENVEPGFSESRWRDGRYRDYPHPAYCLTKHENAEGVYTTNCLAVIGPGTLAESEVAVFEEDAVLVLAVDDTDIGWGDLGDLQVDQIGRPTSVWPKPIYSEWIGILFGDGRAWLLAANVPRSDVELFFTVAGARANDADTILGPHKVFGESFR
ncbi:MAG: hypothetical protein ACYC6Y_28660, partial [Thermoguttaceae bacterium]